MLLHAPAEAVSRRLSPTAGRVEAVGSERCVLHAGSNALEEIAVYVGVLGVEFEVLDPPELVDHLRELSERLGRAVRR